MASLSRDAASLARRALSAATPWFAARTGAPLASETIATLGGVTIARPAPPPHVRAWTRAARAAPYGAAPRVVPRIRGDNDRDESRGARSERLRKARVQHEVRLFKDRAKEELSKEQWVRRKLAEAGVDAATIEARAMNHERVRTTEDVQRNDLRVRYGSNRGREDSSWRTGLAGAKPKKTETDSREEIPESRQRCVRVGVVGVPNAGKSQLVNALVGSHVSAVSPKTNTTRGETLAAITRDETQILFVDLPGIVGPEHHRNPKHAAKVGSAWASAASCDALLFIVDAHRQSRRPDFRVSALLSEARENLERERSRRFPADGASPSSPTSVLVLNKVDLFEPGERDAVKRVARELASLHPFSSLFPISAKRGAGVDAVLEHFASSAPLRRWMLDPRRTTDKSAVDRAIEVVRECVYQRLHKELPYNVVPLHDTWENFRNGDYKIEQTLVVDSVNVKQIVVGRRGSAIGQIGIRARTILEEIFGRKVHLVLHVKVRKKNRGGGARRLAGENDDKY